MSVCDALFARMQAEIELRGLDLRLLTLTLDPNYDTPFVMARFARAVEAHVPTWRFAGGAPRAVRALIHAFGVTVVSGERGIPDQHSSFAYLLDERGHLVRTFPLSSTLSAARVLAAR